MKKDRVPEVRISLPLMALLGVMYVMDYRNIFFPTLLAVSIHEISHIVAIVYCGGTVEKIDVRAFGIRVDVPELKLMPYKKEIIIAAAGPCAGMVTAMVAMAAAKIFDVSAIGYFAGVNAVVTAINMIPVYPLDGGRIARALLLTTFSMRVAYVLDWMLVLVSIGTLVAVCFLLSFKHMLNPSLLIFTLYIAVCGVRFRAPI